MPRELMKDKRQRAIAIALRMNEHYPAAECALHYWGDPFKLTIADGKHFYELAYELPK